MTFWSNLMTFHDFLINFDDFSWLFEHIWRLFMTFWSYVMTFCSLSTHHNRCREKWRRQARECARRVHSRVEWVVRIVINSKKVSEDNMVVKLEVRKNNKINSDKRILSQLFLQLRKGFSAVNRFAVGKGPREGTIYYSKMSRGTPLV